MTGTRADSPPGLDLDRLGDWLQAHAPSIAGGGLEVRHLTGGKSNLTYELTIDGQSLVLRRPPLGRALTTAHDMAREYRVMSALAETEVPVPKVFAFCDDLGVLGASFILMERVDGRSFFRASELEPLGPTRVRAISEGLVDTLCQVHQVDHVAVGLGTFGRPEGFLTRQVHRWRKQFDASRTRDLKGLDTLYSRLVETVPPSGPTGVVHGDFKLDNVLVDGDRPAAVIDWEMSTIGDTLTDIALMVVYQRLGAVAGSPSISDSHSAPGFLDEHDVLERYAQVSGRSLRGLGYYVALASFKLAGIVEGVHFRFVNGQTVGDGFDHLGEASELLIASGLTSIKEFA